MQHRHRLIRWEFWSLALVTMVVATCGPGDGPTAQEETTKIEIPKVIGSCNDAESGLCLNYIKLPQSGTLAELKEACDGNRVWSEDACPTENVYAECDVLSDGGEVVTWFSPPYLRDDSMSRCEAQGGTYKEF